MKDKDRKELVKGIEEIINVGEILDDIITAVGEKCNPEDVFTEDQLRAWAEDNGFVEAD